MSRGKLPGVFILGVSVQVVHVRGGWGVLSDIILVNIDSVHMEIEDSQ